MAKPFDAYQTWLGIPPENQPPNYYDLVGVKLFEPRASVIKEGASDQIAALSDRGTTDEFREIVARLTERIETARDCLLDDAKKRQYDEKLRARQQVRDRTVAAPKPPPTSARAHGVKSPPPGSPESRLPAKGRPLPLIVGGIGAVVAVFAIIAAGLAMRSGDPPATPRAEEPGVSVTKPNSTDSAIPAATAGVGSEPPPGTGSADGVVSSTKELIAISKFSPRELVEGGDLKIWLSAQPQVAKFAFRVHPHEEWTPVERGGDVAAFGGERLGGRPMAGMGAIGSRRPGVFGPADGTENFDPHSLRIPSVTLGLLKLQVRGMDRDGNEVATVSHEFPVVANPWKNWRQSAVLSHGSSIDGLHAAANERLLVKCRGPESVPTSSRRTIPTLSGQGQFTGTVTQCVVWSTSGKLESAISVSGLIGATLSEEGKPLLLRRELMESATAPPVEQLFLEANGNEARISDLEGTSGVLAVAFCGDQKIVAVEVQDSVRLMNTSDQKLLHTFRIEADGGPAPARAPGLSMGPQRFPSFESLSTPHARRLTFSPDATLLARADSQRAEIVIWNTSEKRRVVVLPALATDLSFNADGSQVAICNPESLQVWRVGDGKMIWQDSAATAAVTFSHDGKFLAVGRGNSVAILRAADGYLVRELVAHDGPISNLVFSADGTALASAASDNTVRIWRELEQNQAPISETAPPPLSGNLVLIDRLIAAGKHGEALDQMPLTYQSESKQANLDPQLVPFDGADLMIEPEYRSMVSKAAAGQPRGFAVLIQQRQFNELQQRVQQVEVEKLSADYQLRLAAIIKSLSVSMSEQAQAALKETEQRMGKERLQSDYAIFRDFPPTVLPADFVDEQQRMQAGRRDSARRVLQKALEARRKGKPIDKKSLEVIVNQEFFLPDEAAAAKRLTGRE